MWSQECLLQNAPDFIHPEGEEVWCENEFGLVLIRLKPGAKSTQCYHCLTEEIYTVLKGCVKIVFNNYNTGEDRLDHYLNEGQTFLMAPPHSHQLVNDTDDDVIIFGRVRIPWAPQIV